MSAMGELAKLRARAEAGDVDAALELCRRIAAGKYVLMREREWHALRAHYREICRAGRAPIRRIHHSGSRRSARQPRRRRRAPNGTRAADPPRDEPASRLPTRPLRDGRLQRPNKQGRCRIIAAAPLAVLDADWDSDELEFDEVEKLVRGAA